MVRTNHKLDNASKTKTSWTEVNQSFAMDQWTQIFYVRTTLYLPLHLVLIQEGVIHSLDCHHLPWPRQTCTLTLPASDLQALRGLNLQSLLTLSQHLTTHGTSQHTSWHTSQHLRHLRHTSPTNMQTVKQTLARHHCVYTDRMPASLEVSHTPSSPPPNEDATLAGGVCSPH